MILPEALTLLVWGIFAAYLSLGVVILLAAGMLRREQRAHHLRVQRTLDELRRMKRSIDYLETSKRAERGDFTPADEE